MLTSVQDRHAKFQLYGDMNIVAKFVGIDVDVQHIQVNCLKTPLGEQPVAILRTSDVISFDIDLK